LQRPSLVWETTKEIIGTGSAEEAAYVLVDGHNRYNICSELGINFNVQLVPFDSIKEAKEYMIDLQLGRRNLNPQQASYLRGLRYQTEKLMLV
jgi:ParB-like chromosome segregation protein Spo0J